MVLNDDHDELILDWAEVSRQIPESNHPEGPIQLIKTCLENHQELDYGMVEDQLQIFLENLKKSFNELNR